MDKNFKVKNFRYKSKNNVSNNNNKYYNFTSTLSKINEVLKLIFSITTIAIILGTILTFKYFIFDIKFIPTNIDLSVTIALILTSIAFIIIYLSFLLIIFFIANCLLHVLHKILYYLNKKRMRDTCKPINSYIKKQGVIFFIASYAITIFAIITMVIYHLHNLSFFYSLNFLLYIIIFIFYEFIVYAIFIKYYEDKNKTNFIYIAIIIILILFPIIFIRNINFTKYSFKLIQSRTENTMVYIKDPYASIIKNDINELSYDDKEIQGFQKLKVNIDFRGIINSTIINYKTNDGKTQRMEIPNEYIIVPYEYNNMENKDKAKNK